MGKVRNWPARASRDGREGRALPGAGAGVLPGRRGGGETGTTPSALPPRRHGCLGGGALLPPNTGAPRKTVGGGEGEQQQQPLRGLQRGAGCPTGACLPASERPGPWVGWVVLESFAPSFGCPPAKGGRPPPTFPGAGPLERHGAHRCSRREREALHAHFLAQLWGGGGPPLPVVPEGLLFGKVWETWVSF